MEHNDQPVMEWTNSVYLDFLKEYQMKILLRNREVEDEWRDIISAAKMNVTLEKLLKKLSSPQGHRKRLRTTTPLRHYGSLQKFGRREAFKFLNVRDQPRPESSSESESSSEIAEDTEADDDFSQNHEKILMKDQERQRQFFIPKPMKEKTDNPRSTLITNAGYNLQSATEKLEKSLHEPSTTDSFLIYVAIKVSKYSTNTQNAIQHAIFDILKKADNGFYEFPQSNC